MTGAGHQPGRERPEHHQREHQERAHQERHEHHTADPAALEDPVHHDVAEHELEVESESDDEDPAAATAAARSDYGPASDWNPVPAPEPTGDARVDAAVARLAEVRSRPDPEHVEVYEDVHRRLQDALADLDGT